MEALVLIIEACFWILGVFWAVVSIFFWVGIGLLFISFIAFLFRRSSPSAAPAVDPVAAVREALRRGELDADIGRVEQRNRQRGRLQ